MTNASRCVIVPNASVILLSLNIFIIGATRCTPKKAPPDRARASHALTAETVVACTGFAEPLIAVPATDLFASIADTNPTFMRSFALASRPELMVVTTLLDAKPERFERGLQAWLIGLQALDGDSGSLKPDEVAARARRLWERSESIATLPSKQRLRIRQFGLGMGGSMTWASGPIANGAELTVIVMLYASDYELTDAARKSVFALTGEAPFQRAFECLEAAIRR
jgi:hypothetical protein